MIDKEKEDIHKALENLHREIIQAVTEIVRETHHKESSNSTQNVPSFSVGIVVGIILGMLF